MKINTYEECVEAIQAVRAFVVEQNNKTKKESDMDALMIAYIHINSDDAGFHGIVRGPHKTLAKSLLVAHDHDANFANLLDDVSKRILFAKLTDGKPSDGLATVNDVRHV